jgi:hypothetical protein
MPPDLAALSGDRTNRAVLSVLSRGAVSRPADDPWALDGFELDTHPDLCERLDQLAVGKLGGGSIGLDGVPALVEGSVIYAVARGTSRIDLRIPSGPSLAEALEHGGEPAADFGTGWICVDAWLTDLPSVKGAALLRSWVAAAAGMADDDG